MLETNKRTISNEAKGLSLVVRLGRNYQAALQDDNHRSNTMKTQNCENIIRYDSFLTHTYIQIYIFIKRKRSLTIMLFIIRIHRNNINHSKTYSCLT